MSNSDFRGGLSAFVAMLEVLVNDYRRKDEAKTKAADVLRFVRAIDQRLSRIVLR